MKFILKLSLKNISRNHRRTLLTSLGIMIAVATTIFGKCFIDGAYNPFVEQIANLQTGHVRIITNDYLKKERMLPVNSTIDYVLLESIAEKSPYLKKTVPRIKFPALMAKDELELDGILCIGIYPEREKGGFLGDFTLNSGEILLSQNFAQKHGIELLDTILLISRTKFGYLNGLSFIVRNFYESDIEYISSQLTFITLKDAQFLLSFKENEATEMLLFAHSMKRSGSLYKDLMPLLNDYENLSIKFWEEEGTMVSAVKSAWFIMYMIAFIIFFIASIAIVNTMIMSLYERKKEIGMIKAMGLSNFGVIKIFVLETLFIGLLGSILGLIIGFILSSIFSRTGINYQDAFKHLELPLNPIIYPVVNPFNIMSGFILGMISSVLSSMFVLKRIIKINPAEILRE